MRPLQKREAEVPKAKRYCVQKQVEDFLEWYEMRKHVPLLKAVKIKLGEIHSSPLFPPHPLHDTALPDDAPEEKIQRVINGMAHKVRRFNQQGCHYIEAIHEFISTGKSPTNGLCKKISA